MTNSKEYGYNAEALYLKRQNIKILIDFLQY